MGNSQKMIRTHVTLSRRDKEKLVHDAALCNMSQNEYVRRILRGEKPRAFPPKEFMEILSTMNRIQRSLIRIADVAQYSEPANDKSILTLIDAYNTIIKELEEWAFGE